MEIPTRGSVTAWLDGLKAQDHAAAQELWNRYFRQLTAVAQRHLRGIAREADEEDVALSAMKSAMLGVQDNKFPDLCDRTGLWPLLVTITARKAINEVKRHARKKRARSSEVAVEEMEALIGSGPSPDFAIRMIEAIAQLVKTLNDPTLQLIARRKLEGYGNEEIAHELDVSTRTVVRKLSRIRKEWDQIGLTS
jgi:RNA polymerase sigma factor (sigma-70 family)